MINPNNELFLWGPIDGKPIYPSYFCISIAQTTHLKYKIKWPSFPLAFFKDKMTAIVDKEKIYAQGEKYFNYWILDDKKFKQANNDYKKALFKLKNCQKKLTKKYLASLTKKELFENFREWHEIYLEFWDVGLVPEIANWGGEKILKESLKEYKKEIFIELFEKLSAPVKLSFYQKEELELLKITLKKDQEKLLVEHAKKYYWINNSYHSTEILNKEYFIKKLSKFDNVKIKISQIENFCNNTLIKKKEIINKYSISKDIIKIGDRLSYAIAWQDERKAQIFIANHFIKLFLTEIGRRYELLVEDLEWLSSRELLSLLKDISFFNKINVNKRKNFCAFLMEEKVILKTDSKSKKYIESLLHKEIKKVKEIKGMVVSNKKPVRGKVRILLTAKNTDKMKKGEILVAPMTSPEFIIAMRKASGIVTDAGGMTCHAAIVSRELGVPCIVGTKIATKLLNNGDLVEVDTQKGLVRIIK